jgi:hypothetical protein
MEIIRRKQKNVRARQTTAQNTPDDHEGIRSGRSCSGDLSSISYRQQGGAIAGFVFHTRDGGNLGLQMLDKVRKTGDAPLLGGFDSYF